MNRFIAPALALIFSLAFAAIPALNKDYNDNNDSGLAYLENSITSQEGIDIDKIVLSKSEIENLGITVKVNKIIATIENLYKINPRTSEDFVSLLTGKGYNAKTGIYRSNVTIDPVSILPEEEPLQYEGWSMVKGSTMYPVAITSEFSGSPAGTDNITKSSIAQMYVAGNSPLLKEFTNDRLFKWNKKRFTPTINKLLPVTLASEGSGSSIKITFWYLASRELVDKLPDRYKEGLKKELGIVDSVNSGKLPYDEACNKVDRNSNYFDICGVSSGALGGLTIFPHPVVANARCRLLLKESRTISMQLYDGSGALISNILTNSGQLQGTPEFDIPFDEMSSGIYILVVTSDRNEKITAKIIVNK